MLHHALWLGWTAPESNISCRCVWTSSTNGGGIHINHSLNGSVISTFNHMFHWMSTAKPTGLQGKDIEVLGQDRLGRIPQLRWPAFQSAQIQVLEQFLLPLFHRQLWHLQALGLTPSFHYPGLHRWLRYVGGHNWPCHQFSSLESRDMPYYFSLLQWHSCCTCTTLYKHSVLLSPGVMTHLWCTGLESSHSPRH